MSANCANIFHERCWVFKCPSCLTGEQAGQCCSSQKKRELLPATESISGLTGWVFLLDNSYGKHAEEESGPLLYSV